MGNELVIGACIVVGVAACIAYFLPSLSKRENITIRVEALTATPAIQTFGRAGDAQRRRQISLLQEISKFTVDRLKLRSLLRRGDYKEKLFRAGYRSPSAETTFIFARFAAPIVCSLIALIYLFGLQVADWPAPAKVSAVLAAGLLGLKLPDIIIKNAMDKRQSDIRMAWPDALDLMVICVESGTTAEAAFRRVAKEISLQSEPLAQELNFTLAELNTLSDRTAAYKNLGLRTNIDEVKSTCTALIQAETQGTPVASALRSMSSESRITRMQAAKKKAASLGPKLTVPMILFFLPVLFAIIIMPGVIDIMGWK
ncbi:MAG: type II secretion system protein [Stutzerimonas stutzeri]|nr:MAG: type II secretion system protein [Stutzerimonas stutzeri]